ncbi:MAG TPA: acetolactate decarboxylase [Gaiellaceae bacterium]|nr:acetolactate decarboxylase [Gaiellaceae bacterium]
MAGSRFIHLMASDPLWQAICERRAETGLTTKDVVVAALQQYLGLDDSAFQTSTIGAVMDGVYHGDTTVGELREHGDLGIGTFDELDGEMVMVDGTTYRIDAECRAHPAHDDARTPFATVTHWIPKHSVDVAPGTDLAGLQSTLEALMSSHNYLYAVRAECRFGSIRVRSVRPQEPGTRLVDATRSQTVRDLDGSEGTLVGFFTPTFLAHVGVPGLHLHFITEGRDAGGHVLSLTVDRGTLMADETTRLTLTLPDTAAFRGAELGVDEDELEVAETERG